MTLKEAFKAIGQNPDFWHCWIVDIDLGNDQCGLDLLSHYPQFPFAIVLSGLQSMSIATQAIKKGALGVFDKDPISIEQMYEMVCKIAALGYVLNGKPTKNFEIYRLLGNSIIKTVEVWAEAACISVRQLHRICDLHPINNPRTTLSLYYSLYALLWYSNSTYTGNCP